MKKIFVLFLLCFSFSLAAQKQAGNNYAVLARQCDSLTDKGEFEAAMKIARKSLQTIDKEDWKNLSLFNYYIATGIELPANYDTAVYYFERSVAYARKQNDPLILAWPLRRLILAYYASGENVKQDKVAYELEAMADTTKNEDLRVGNRTVLANYYAANGIHEKQLTYLLEDIAYMQKQLNNGKGDKASCSNAISVDLIKIAELYNINLKQPEKSIEYLKMAKPYISSTNKGASAFYYKLYADALIGRDKISLAMSYYDSVTQMCSSGMGMACNIRVSLDLLLAEHNLDKSNHEQAALFLQKGRALGLEYAQDPTSQAQMNYLEGRLQLAGKNYPEALSFFRKAEENAGSVSLDFYAIIKGELAKCYAGMGRWQPAYEYAAQNIKLQDSIYAEKAKQTLANAEAKYQNKTKQQQIETQNVQLTYARKQRLWLFAGLVLSALVALLLVVIYRNKKRTADILDRKNKKLSQLNTDLEEANQTKAKLFSIISHDLRSPISQVYQFLKLQQLDPDRLNDEQKAALNHKIQAATGSLLETMEDLLLWSKTQMNQFNADMQPVAINNIVSESLQLLQLNSDAKGLDIKTADLDDVTVNSDPYFLQAIVRNLLQNAIKAAPHQGSVRIGFSEKVLSIYNQGPYFSQKDYEAAITAADAGKSLSGLGLRLVDELSRKIDASVYFADTGGGTCACISIR